MTGGASIGTGTATRTMTAEESHKVDRDIFNEYKEYVIKSGETQRGDYDDDGLGWSDNGKIGSSCGETVDIKNVYPDDFEYWNAVTDRLQYKLSFEAKEENNGYQHVQITRSGAVSTDFYPNNGNYRAAGGAAVDAGRYLSEYISGSPVQYLATFEHGGGALSATKGYAQYYFPSGAFSNSNPGICRMEEYWGNQDTQAEDGSLSDLYTSGMQITFGFGASGSGRDKWYTRNLTGHFKLVDTEGPKLLGIAPMAEGTAYLPGDTITLALVFDEIVDQENSALKNVQLKTNLGDFTYAGGADTNVLYFTGKAPDTAFTQVTISEVENSNGIEDMAGNQAGNLLSGNESAAISSGSADKPTVSVGKVTNNDGTLTAVITGQNGELEYAWSQEAAVPAYGWQKTTSGSTVTTYQEPGSTWYLHARSTNSDNRTVYAYQKINLPALKASLSEDSDNTDWASSRTIALSWRYPESAAVTVTRPDGSTGTIPAGANTYTATQNGEYVFSITADGQTVTSSVEVAKIINQKPSVSIDYANGIPTAKMTLYVSVSQIEKGKYPALTGVWELNGEEYSTESLTPDADGVCTVTSPNKDGTWTFTVTAAAGGLSDSASVTLHQIVFTDGVASQQVVDGDTAFEPDIPSKTGYRFGGWYNGDNPWTFNTPVTESVSLTARWTAETYTITYSGLDGATLTQKPESHTYGTATAVGNPTKPNHNFGGWKINGNGPAIKDLTLGATDYTDDITLEATWTKNHTVTLPENQTGYTLTAPNEVDNGGSITLTLTLQYGYSATDNFKVQANGVDVEMTLQNGVYTGTVSNILEDLVITVAGVADITAPAGEIKVKENSWKNFINKITFGIFCKDPYDVMITASDDGSGVNSITYYVADAAISKDDIQKVEGWTSYQNSFSLTDERKYIVYAKITDNSGNITYISTDGMVVDKTAPAISGIENGKTCCAAVEVTVSDDYLESVTLNGNPVIYQDGKFTVNPAEGVQTIVVTDKAKNSTTYTITVNDGHTFTSYHSNGDATCTADGTETAKCDYCDATDTRTDSDSKLPHQMTHYPYQAATCMKTGNVEYWHCAGCNQNYNSEQNGNAIENVELAVDPDNHSPAASWTQENDKHYHVCENGCGKHLDEKICSGGTASYFKQAVCEICSNPYGSKLQDTTKPTGEIALGTNKWNEFLNTITFGLFFKETQTVTITAADDSYAHDGYTDEQAVKAEYYLHTGGTALTENELKEKTFTEYTKAFSINPDNKYVIYAKLTDYAGNTTYISSKGVILDASTPGIPTINTNGYTAG